MDYPREMQRLRLLLVFLLVVEAALRWVLVGDAHLGTARQSRMFEHVRASARLASRTNI